MEVGKQARIEAPGDLGRLIVKVSTGQAASRTSVAMWCPRCGELHPSPCLLTTAPPLPASRSGAMPLRCSILTSLARPDSLHLIYHRSVPRHLSVMGTPVALPPSSNGKGTAHGHQASPFHTHENLRRTVGRRILSLQRGGRSP